MMRYIPVHFLVITALFGACTSASDNGADNDNAVAVKTDTVAKSSSEKKHTPIASLPANLSALVPIDLLDSQSTNVYEKYGLAFSGNCYACDLASLSVTQHKMVWTNVCDENDAFVIDHFTFAVAGNSVALETSARKYVLTLIDKAPVYQLTLVGEKLELSNKKLSKYFTTKDALPLFNMHDCGDFDG